MNKRHVACASVLTLLGSMGIGCGDHSGVVRRDDAGLNQSDESAQAPGDGATRDGAARGPVDGGTGENTQEADGGARDGAGARPMFPPVSDFSMPGPFATLSEPTNADCTVYRPMTLGEAGRVHPVIIWGNGTGTPTVEVYAGFFNHWASHGFIVAAAHTPTAGSGMEMLACLAWVEAEHARAGSPYEGHVDLGNVGASGHSQGGGGAVMVGRDPRVRATVPLQAWTGAPAHEAGAEMRQTGPMFLVSGDADVIAAPEANQKPLFEGSNVPTFWATLAGGDHVTIALGNVAKYLAPTLAWFRLHLMADEGARSMFYGPDCGLCRDTEWTVERKLIQ